MNPENETNNSPEIEPNTQQQGQDIDQPVQQRMSQPFVAESNNFRPDDIGIHDQTPAPAQIISTTPVVEPLKDVRIKIPLIISLLTLFLIINQLFPMKFTYSLFIFPIVWGLLLPIFLISWTNKKAFRKTAIIQEIIFVIALLLIAFLIWSNLSDLWMIFYGNIFNIICIYPLILVIAIVIAVIRKPEITSSLKKYNLVVGIFTVLLSVSFVAYIEYPVIGFQSDLAAIDKRNKDMSTFVNVIDSNDSKTSQYEKDIKEFFANVYPKMTVESIISNKNDVNKKEDMNFDVLLRSKNSKINKLYFSQPVTGNASDGFLGIDEDAIVRTVNGKKWAIIYMIDLFIPFFNDFDSVEPAIQKVMTDLNKSNPNAIVNAVNQDEFEDRQNNNALTKSLRVDYEDYADYKARLAKKNDDYAHGNDVIYYYDNAKKAYIENRRNTR